MAVASFDRIKKRAIAILMANSAYATTVSGDVGRFVDSQEFIDAALQRDAELMTAAIENPNHWVRAILTPTLSSALQNNADLPSGIIGKPQSVVWSATSGGTYADSTEMESKDEVLEVNEDASLYGNGTTDNYGFHYLDKGKLFITSPYAKIYYFTFSIGGSPQSPESFEDAIAQGVVSTLFKDGAVSPEIHLNAEKKFQQKLAEIRAFSGKE